FAALNAEVKKQYPDQGDEHFRLDADEIGAGRGALFVAYLEDRPIGCGSIRKLDTETAELKRMYVAGDMRGHGIGGALMRALETEARDLAVRRILIETGDRQDTALAMYEGAGYRRIPYFGDYSASSTSICLAKDL
ncbi:MAG TPA: GNAT family N-acetyltransferase, partial [Acidobacteriota bacterium]|nr:GNAT family N-acetyltransferase [Acidobacteriota bacterium]